MKQKEYIMNATTNYYGMFSEAGNSAVDAIVEAVEPLGVAVVVGQPLGQMQSIISGPLNELKPNNHNVRFFGK